MQYSRSKIRKEKCERQMCTSVTIDNNTSSKLVVDFIYFYDDIIVVHNGDDVAGSTVLRPDVKRHFLQKYDNKQYIPEVLQWFQCSIY